MVVLERYSDADVSKVGVPHPSTSSHSQCVSGQMSHGGIRLPPNVSKVLFHWGLEHQLRQLSITSNAMEVEICSYTSAPHLHSIIDYIYRRNRRVYWYPSVGRRGFARDWWRFPLFACMYNLLPSLHTNFIYS